MHLLLILWEFYETKWRTFRQFSAGVPELLTFTPYFIAALLLCDGGWRTCVRVVLVGMALINGIKLSTCVVICCYLVYEV